jgi:PAS domain S-box-containing protein
MLAGLAAVYVLLALGGLEFASVHPSASPVWPPSGFAIAALLLFGMRAAPAVFAGAFLANWIAAGSLGASLAIGAGNAAEALLAACLVNRWSGGVATFDAPARVVRFALACLPATAVSATAGAVTLAATSFTGDTDLLRLWLTWWMGDFAGALLVTPALVLWWRNPRRHLTASEWPETLAVYGTAVLAGLLVLSPLATQEAARAPLGILAVAPLIWAALRRGPREVAGVALVLSAFAVWGLLEGGGPFARGALDDSFLALLACVATILLPSLALGAAMHGERGPNEAALQSTAQQYRLMVDAVHDYALYMLDPTGRVASWNAGAARIKQYTAGEIIGQHFSRFYTARDRARGEPARALRVAESEGRYEAESRRVRKDGTEFWANIVIDPIRDPSGNLVGFAKITRDITERKEAQLALEETRERLAQSQKLEAVGQLTGGIAHDFNNLLMIVSGYARILRRGVSEPKLVKAAESIQSAAARGAALTRQLLTFSRRQAVNPVAADLRAEVESVTDMLSRTLPGNIAIHIDIPDDTGRTRIDTGEFELALLNIVVNARDAMPKGGTLSISARNRTCPAEAGRPAGDFVALAVSDTGTGIPPDLMPRVFEPFFTTKATGKGTGLGLSQVYGFAHQAGGTVTIESEAGRGTTVTMLLPRTDEPLPRQTETLADELKSPTGSILLVEDNSEVAAITTAMLEQDGCRVTHAADAEEALARLERSREDFDLVLSDVVMPGGMDGIQLAYKIRAQYPQLPVLLTSGYSDAIPSAAATFLILRKPFDAAALTRAVHSAICRSAAVAPAKAG